MNILITSAGRRVSLIRAFKKELINFFHNGKVFTTDISPELSSACQDADGYFKVPRVNEANYISELCEIVKNNRIGLIIPTIDSELLLLSEHIEEIEVLGCKVVVSDKNLIAKCRDKRQTSGLFSSYGIQVPKIYDKDNFQYPMFVKPFDGSRSVDAHLVNNEEELQERFITNDRFMLMEYIDHSQHVEYTVDAYYDKNSNLKCLIPRERILIRDGEVNKGITRKNEVYDILIKKLSSIKGAIGVLTIQFFVNKENNKMIYGIEINPRFGGGFPLSYDAGGNYPGYIIREYLMGEEIDWCDSWEDHCLMLRYDSEVIVHGYTAEI